MAFWKKFSLAFCTVFFVISSFSFIHAQEGGIDEGEAAATNPKDREIDITATVPVLDAPPAPVLVSPENESFITTSKPTFVWELLSHIAPYSRQELNINGEVIFSNIALDDEENSNYTLILENGEYRLTLKDPEALADGEYTWKIRIIDANDRGRDSGTWLFTIDTQSPQLLITQIDTQTTSISAKDATTVPTTAFTVNVRQPVISGTTEAAAEVELTVTFPDGTKKLLSTTADASGNYRFTLPTLNQDQVVELALSAIDEAGNTSALSGVKVVYKPRVITFPLIPLPLVPEFLYPEIPIIEIPLVPPAIPEIELPKFIEEPVREVPKIVRRFRWDLLGGSIILFWLYLIILFWLTGNWWRFFGRFVGEFLLNWFYGTRLRRHVWRSISQTPLPHFAFVQEWFEVNTKQITKAKGLSTLQGEWELLPRQSQLLTMIPANRRWQLLPTKSTALLLLKPQPNEFWIHGQQIQWSNMNSKPAGTGEVFSLPVNFMERLVFWIEPKRKLPPAWLRWIPRFCLGLALILAITVVFAKSSIPSIVWMIFILWVFFRDLQWNLPEKWKVYVSGQVKSQ